MTIDENGLFVAGETVGVTTITATDPESEITAEVIIWQAIPSASLWIYLV